MYVSAAGMGLPEGPRHAAPAAPEAPDEPYAGTYWTPPPSTVMFHAGNAISLAHRMTDEQKNPATLVFLPQPTGSTCRAAVQCDMDLLLRSTYHHYRAAFDSMQPLDLMFIPDGCLLFRDPRLYDHPLP